MICLHECAHHYPAQAQSGAGDFHVIGQTTIGSIDPVRVGAIRYAANFTGGDCGAKINAALSDGGANAHVFIDQACGTTWTTAVTATDFQILDFVEGGTYTLNNTVTGGHIVGVGFGAPHTTGNAPVRLRQGNAQNLAFLVKVNTDNGSVRDIEIDGNKANNTGTTDCLFIDGARGVRIGDTYVHDCDRDGIVIKSTTVSNNDAGVCKLRGVVSHINDRDGLHVEDATDVWIAMSEFEDNLRYGAYLEDAAGSRIIHSDFAHNTDSGLFATGTAGQLTSNYLIIVANQFGNGEGHSLQIDGHDGTGYVSIGNTITGNVVFGGDQRTSNTFDAFRLEDTHSNTVTGNVINSPTANSFRYGIAAIDTGQTSVSDWFSNQFVGTFGTGEKLAKAGVTKVCDVDCNVRDLGVSGSDLYIGGDVGATNSTQILHAGGFTIGGVTGNQFNLGQTGVAFRMAFDTSGNFGITGNYGWSSGTASAGTFDHAITANRTWTFPDLAGTVALTDGVQTLNFDAATSLDLPQSAGASPTQSSQVAYDTTSNTLEYGENGTNRTVMNLLGAQTPQNKTIDESNNSIIASHFIEYAAAGCQDTSAFSGFNWTAANAPNAPVCINGTNVKGASLGFADAVTDGIQGSFWLPPDWTGAIDVSGVWRSATASTNTVRFTIALACVADGETMDPAFTPQNIDDAGKGTANQLNTFLLTSISTTGTCAVNELAFWRLQRLGADAADTFTGTADFLKLRFRIRRDH